VCVISRHTWGAAVKRTQSGEADTIKEQQAEVYAVRSDHARLLLARDSRYRSRHQSRELCLTHTDVVKEVRQQKHNYVWNKERTIMWRAVLTRTEERSPSTSAQRRVAAAGVITDCVRCRLYPKGYLESVDRLEYWNGLNSCKKPSRK